MENEEYRTLMSNSNSNCLSSQYIFNLLTLHDNPSRQSLWQLYDHQIFQQSLKLKFFSCYTSSPPPTPPPTSSAVHSAFFFHVMFDLRLIYALFKWQRLDICLAINFRWHFAPSSINKIPTKKEKEKKTENVWKKTIENEMRQRS